MTPTLASLALASLLAPLAGDELSCVVTAEPSSRPVHYAWDGRPPVPWTHPDGAVELVYGEAGVVASTRVYLPLNAGAGMPRDVARPATPVTAAGFEWGGGRFGAGLVDARGRGVVTIGDEDGLVDGDFTVELRLRVDRLPPPRTNLVQAPGAFRLFVTADGRLQATFDGLGLPRLVSAAPVQRGRWHHVAVSLDVETLGYAKLVLDGVPRSRVVRERDVRPTATRLVIRNLTGAIDDVRVDARATPTAELERRATVAPVVGPHELELAYAASTRTIERIHRPRRWPTLEDAGAFASGELEHALATDDGLVWVPGNWERLEARGGPLARTTHPTVEVGDGQLFLFGGETRDTHVWPMRNTADTWIFHTGTATWERVLTPVAPSPRCHQSAAYSPDHDIVLLAGGHANDDDRIRVFDDTWVFHVSERRWERRRPTGDTLRPMSDSEVVYVPSRRAFFLISGLEAWIYDPEFDHWKRRRPPRISDAGGDWLPPVGMGSAMAGFIPSADSVLLYGGEFGAGDGREYLDHTLVYDLRENWFIRLPRGADPPARVRAGFAYDSLRERFVLFGGVRGHESRRMEDLWTIDHADRTWRRARAANAPSARGGYFGMAYVPESDRFFLLCGRHSFDRFLDEAWSLRLDETAVGRALYTFDRSDFPDHDRWFDAVERTEGASVELRFRGGPSDAELGPWHDDPGVAVGADARLVQVEARLVPGPGGGAPRLLRCGFGRSDEESATGVRALAATGTRYYPLLDLHWRAAAVSPLVD